MSIFSTTELEFAELRQEEGGVHSFVFTPLARLPYAAGQHGLLTLPGGGTKPFSLASAPEDAEVVIGTRLQSNSAFKQALANLQPGQRVSFRGPLLNFTLKDAPRQVVLLAQGVGVTPFRSMLRHVELAQLDRRTTLIQVGDGHAYRTDTETLATTAVYPTDREGFRLAVGEAVALQPEARYYLSGSGRFVTETNATLTALGVRRQQIKKARFLGYGRSLSAQAPAGASTPDATRR